MELLEHLFEYVALAIDLIGIGIILWGFSLSFKDWLILEMSKGETMGFLQGTRMIRCQLGTYLLLGLEFMIASDIIHSFISRSPDDLLFLGLIVVIRTTNWIFSWEKKWKKYDKLINFLETIIHLRRLPPIDHCCINFWNIPDDNRNYLIPLATTWHNSRC